VSRSSTDWLRWYRILCWSLAGPLTLAGVAGSYLFMGTGPALFMGCATAAVVAATASQVRLSGNRRHSFQELCLVGLAGGLAMLGLVGLILAIGVAGFGLAVLAGVAAWPAFRSLRRRPGPVPTAPSQDVRPAMISAAPARESMTVPPLPVLPALASLPTATLCWVWRMTYLRLHGSSSPSETEAVIRLRRECLDQLEQRDACAFGRWFPTARAASDPARFFCPEAA
jgi:hypothetical protein